VKEVAKQGDRREDFKKRLTKVNEHRKMKDYVWSQIVQRNIKISKSVKKRRCRETESSTDEGDEENDVTRFRGRNPVLTRGLPIS
jgi:hypothetical protein